MNRRQVGLTLAVVFLAGAFGLAQQKTLEQLVSQAASGTTGTTALKAEWVGTELGNGDPSDRRHTFIMRAKYDSVADTFSCFWISEDGKAYNMVGPTKVQKNQGGWSCKAECLFVTCPIVFAFDGTTLRLEFGAKYEGKGSSFSRVDFR